MVEIEQERARAFAHAIGANGRAGRDLALIVAAVTLAVVLAVASTASESLLDGNLEVGDTDVSGLLVLGALVPLGAALFTWRRRRDARDATEELEALRTRDGLTGLPNRRVLVPQLDELFRTNLRTNARVAVLFVDVDGSKQVNATLGHAAGDRFIVEVAARLQNALVAGDLLFRFGGAEFVALCPDVTHVASAARIAQRLLRALDPPIELGAGRSRAEVAIGVALAEERCTGAEEVLRDADAAMYRARAIGAGQYALFDRAVPDLITPSTAERRLRRALEDGEFCLYYQPIVSLWTKRMVGVEALLRWRDPTRGLVTPAEFLGALETTGLIVPVGHWVIEEVCRQSVAWHDDHPDRPPVNVKVNISTRQLAQADFVSRLRDAVTRTGIDPDRLCLEINETALMQDVTSASSTLRDARALGVSVALDDFGAGYSSLGYLHRFSVDLLKIDTSFVQGLGVADADRTIVAHVIAMAKALGIVTVAEGVESEEQVLQLRDLHCDLAQGYYFSHPQPPQVIARLLAADGNRQEWRPAPRATTGDADAGPSRDVADRFDAGKAAR
ncbi:MAG: bifunctional diguanylate cyclase/phosphodiesterase [Acidimicrobiales bacterium]|nr:bifunctional diguanylate cyclase/phosphodiesterase [Acidimicrobiales bacterium]